VAGCFGIRADIDVLTGNDKTGSDKPGARRKSEPVRGKPVSD
jgi:hypothetical protein